jgi:hypothetical protein
MVELAFSVLLMLGVVGVLAGWAFREDRRRRHAESEAPGRR